MEVDNKQFILSQKELLKLKNDLVFEIISNPAKDIKDIYVEHEANCLLKYIISTETEIY